MHAKLPPKLNTLIFITKKSAKTLDFFSVKKDEILTHQNTIQVMLIKMLYKLCIRSDVAG